MISIEKGNLTMDEEDWEDVIFEINYGLPPKQSLAKIIDINGFSVKDVNTISLTGGQIKNDKYREVYSLIVCECWNNGW